MNPVDEALGGLVELPADVLAKAQAVPGLPERIVRFIRMEVAMDEQRRERYSPEALELVQRARKLAEERTLAGEVREDGMRTLADHFARITEAP